MISYIVSMYDRVPFLNACLASLAVQDKTSETIVCCNSTDEEVLKAAGLACLYHDVHMEPTGLAGATNPYESASMISIKGEWVCFPSDDSLYVCEFATIMLRTAERAGADLVYCDCVYRQAPAAGNWPPYTVLDVQPRMGKIDKTCFILRRELFKGFPPHPRGWSDGALIDQLVAQGVKHAKAPGVLVIHQ